MTTRGASAPSPSVKFRPRFSATRIASRYPGLTKSWLGDTSDSPGPGL
jgi:hypothetical protein